ncbi:FixH family protein [Psychroflexus maritimus]|uniref:FixH family protein n=1 Tax=Psychroflexus maritimus TaxID=2714865 RepID=A0A967AEI3_9FLAO|nr:FixH family protein [Psychroflexus maritimus]NGZ89803.1 FixH family protein [Psychroflexus maritimus]
MKINWGTSIVIAMLCFIGFIMFFVVQMLSSKNDQDLVVESYYHKELQVQDEIDKVNNLKGLNSTFEIEKTSEGIIINFPSEFSAKQLTGKLTLYRPSDKKLDFTLPIQLKESKQLIPQSLLANGRWNIELDFEVENVPYAYKKELIW